MLQLGLDMEELEEMEEDAGLGNGGLGRLAGKKGCRCLNFEDTERQLENIFNILSPLKLLIVSQNEKTGKKAFKLTACKHLISSTTILHYNF